MSTTRRSTGTQSRLRIATTTPIDFGAEPVEPAERELALLVAGEATRARQETPPMLADDLQAAIGPAVALLLERLEGVGQQAVAVAAVGVVDLPAMLEHGQPEIGVLDRWCRSTSRRHPRARRGGSGTWCRAR